MYDSNMYSSPLSLLQLPASALPEVSTRLAQSGNSIARFSQDGKSLSDLRNLVPEADFRQATEVTVDVGFVCKKCHMVYPAEVLCLNHQRTACFQSKPVGEIKAMLRLVQCHVECRACRERFTTIVDFKFHCDMDRHIKRVQKIQREANAVAGATAASANAGQNHFDALANRMAANAALLNNNNNNNSNVFANDKSSAANDALANRMAANALLNNSNVFGEGNAGDVLANRMVANAVSNSLLNNSNTFDSNAAAAGLLQATRNGMMPDMAQLFFSGMGMDSIRLGLGLEPDTGETKQNKTQAVGCSVDAGVSIS
ncbi:uncharacterized protein LOC129230351 [Uloborus diversus]|uniref:uncharacterized protein LOC129230351 n=1 Tax=Uloborus diversus TaxID=327109 RepID=UPI002409BAB5|nr:uncharacterized protein LOC129230351 [Uloborus diversus]